MNSPLLLLWLTLVLLYSSLLNAEYSQSFAYPTGDVPLSPREFFGLLSEEHVNSWTASLSKDDLDLTSADNFWLYDHMLDSRSLDHNDGVEFSASMPYNLTYGIIDNVGLGEGFSALTPTGSPVVDKLTFDDMDEAESGVNTVILTSDGLVDQDTHSSSKKKKSIFVSEEDNELTNSSAQETFGDAVVEAQYVVVDPLIAEELVEEHRLLVEAAATMSNNVTITVLNVLDNFPANATFCYPQPTISCNLRSAWLACAQINLAAINTQLQPGLCSIVLPFNATLSFNSFYNSLTLTKPMNVALLGNRAKIVQTYASPSTISRFLYFVNSSSLCLNYVSNMPNLRISNLTFAKFGTANTYGGVGYLNGQSRIAVDHVAVTNSTAYYGAAFFFLYNAAGISIEDSSFSRLYAVQNGGAIFVSAGVFNLAIRRSNFSSSRSKFGGCILINKGLSNLLVEDTMFSSCQATTSGGGVYLGTAMNNIYFIRSTFTGNLASYGGGLYISSSNNVNIINSSFVNCVASGGYGGGFATLDSLSNLYVSGSYFGNNQAYFGGGWYLLKGTNISIVDSYFYKNFAATGGSGFMNSNFVNVSISRSLFRQSSGTYYGGAIYFNTLASGVNLTSLAFYGCYLGSAGNGGAIAFYTFNQQVYIANISSYGSYAGYTGGLFFMGYNNTRVVMMNITANTVGATQSSSYGGLVSFFNNNSFCLFDNLQVRNFKANQGGVFNLNSNNSYILIRNSSFINGKGSVSGFASFSNGNNVSVENIYLYNITTTSNLVAVLISNNTRFTNVTAQQSTSLLTITNSNNLTMEGVYLDTLNKKSAINIESNCQNVSITNVVIRNCSATTGGAIYVGDNIVNMSIVDAVIDGNRASKQGGGIYVNKNSPRVSLVNVSLINNQAGMGGGAFIGNGARQVLFSSKNTYTKMKVVQSPHPYVSQQPTNGVRYVIYSANVTVPDASKFLLVFDEQTSLDNIDQIYIYNNYKKQSWLMTINYQCIPGVDCPVVTIPGPSFYIEFMGPTGNSIIEPGYYGFKLYAYPIFANDDPIKVTGNRAVTKGGGIHFDYATSFPLLLNMDISNNKVTNGPGGGLSFQISNSGAFLLKVNMTNNYAKYDGGAIAFLSGQYGVVMNDCTFTNNLADGNGGGHFFASSNGIGIFYSNNNITYNNCIFDGNSAKEHGGAIYTATENALRLTTCSFTNNHADQSGGAIGADELNYIILVSSSVVHNTADTNGGGISATARSSIVLQSTTVSSNTAGKAGGGLFLQTNSILVIQSAVKIRYNQAGQIGGGLVLVNTFWWNFLSSSATLVLSGNKAVRGSAVFVKSLLLTSKAIWGTTTITNNTARGGTIYWVYDSTMYSQPPALTNSKTIIANNTAVFGVVVATQALKVLPPPSYLVTVYAVNLQPAIRVTMEDYYGQFVNISGGTTIYPTIQSSKCTQYPYLAGANTIGNGVSMDNGIASFDSLQTYCSPQGNLTLKFTAMIAVEVGLPDSVIAPYYLQNSTFLTFRACMAGEYESKGLCVVCPESSYSLEPDAQSCASCLSVAGIKTCEGSTIVVEPGYWRRTDQSSVVFSCVLAPESCPGGYGTGDLSCGIGYGGALCAVCSEGYYLNNNQCVSCEGTGKITATTWAVAVIAVLASVIVGVLYYQNYKVNKLLKAKRVLDIEARGDSDDEAEENVEKSSNPDAEDEEEEDALEKSTIHLDYSSTSQLSTLQLVILWVKLKYSELMVKIKIIVSTFQVVTSTASIFSVTLPREFTNFVNVFKVLNLSITSIIPLACESHYSFIDTLLWTTLTPIALAFLLLVAFLLEFSYLRYKIQSQTQRKKGAKKQAFNACKDKYLNYFFYLTYLVLPSVSTTIFQTFVCTNVDPKSEDNYTYDWYLNADMSISCQTDYYYSWVSYAVVMVFVYPIGIPAFYLYVLYLNRGEIASREGNIDLQTDVEDSTASEEAADAVTNNPLHRMSMNRGSVGGRNSVADGSSAVAGEGTVKLSVTEVIIARKSGPKKMSGSAARLAFLWQAYLPAYWYWEVVESTRRIVLTAVLSVTSPGSSKQSVFGVLLAFCYIVLYSTFKPYNEASDATLGETGQIQIFLTFFAALVIQNNLMSDAWDTVLGAMLTIVNMLVIGLTFYFEFASYQAERKEAEAEAEEERRKAANERIAAVNLVNKQNPNRSMSVKFERKTEAELLEAITMEEKLNHRLTRKQKVISQTDHHNRLEENDRGSTVGVELPEWKPKPQTAVAKEMEMASIRPVSTGADVSISTRNPSTTINTNMSAFITDVVPNIEEDDRQNLRLSISEKYRNSRGDSFRGSVLDYKDSDDEDDD